MCSALSLSWWQSVQALWWRDSISAPEVGRRAGVSSLLLLWQCANAGGWPGAAQLITAIVIAVMVHCKLHCNQGPTLQAVGYNVGTQRLPIGSAVLRCQ